MRGFRISQFSTHLPPLPLACAKLIVIMPDIPPPSLWGFPVEVNPDLVPGGTAEIGTVRIVDDQGAPVPTVEMSFPSSRLKVVISDIRALVEEAERDGDGGVAAVMRHVRQESDRAR